MPIYEYFCTSCNAKFEKLRPISAATDPLACPTCGTTSQRAISQLARVRAAGEGGDLGDMDFGAMGGMGGMGDMGDMGGLGGGHDHDHAHGPGGHTH